MHLTKDDDGRCPADMRATNVTEAMISDFCDVLSEFEVEGVAIPERLLERLLMVLVPHLTTHTSCVSIGLGQSPTCGDEHDRAQRACGNDPGQRQEVRLR